jgi:hypothetical protein
MKFAADENLDNNIIRWLQTQEPDIDIIRVQDTPVYTQPDVLCLNG